VKTISADALEVIVQKLITLRLTCDYLANPRSTQLRITDKSIPIPPVLRLTFKPPIPKPTPAVNPKLYRFTTRRPVLDLGLPDVIYLPPPPKPLFDITKVRVNRRTIKL
jgi:hypothetical protein